jgi:signal transduction histidine kinase
LIRKLPYILIFALCVAFAASAMDAIAQNTEYKVQIKKIKINGESLNDFRATPLVFAQDDSVTFIYACKVSPDEKSRFLFRIKLGNGDEESVKATNTPLISYQQLPEGIYNLQIEAFSNEWTANPAEVQFKVDNFEAGIIKENRKLKIEAEVDDKTIAKYIESENREPEEEISSLSIGIGAVGSGLIFGSLLFFTFIRYNKNKKEVESLTELKDKAMKKSEDTKASYDKMLSENSNLKAETSALRGQIDALLNKSQDLQKQNKDLQDSVTKLKESQKEVAELQVQKDELFAIIIHDIKNPVSLIKNLVELLRSYDLTATEQSEVIDDILKTTSKIVSLSQEVSRILALEGSKIVINFEPCQINEILRDVHLRNNVSAKKKNITMLLDLVDDLPEVELDFQKVDEVLDNLISNAIKFSDENGKIRLRAIKEGANCVVEISDKGLGLSEEDVQMAFQRGAKLSARPTANEPSSGLGLWIVKKLIEAHNGRVWVRSSLGKGSTFAFSIPFKQTKEK